MMCYLLSDITGSNIWGICIALVGHHPSAPYDLGACILESNIEGDTQPYLIIEIADFILYGFFYLLF